MEVERLQSEYPVDVRWAPYLLDPTIPAEGKPRKPQTRADSPKSHLEEMAEARGLTFKRGRTFTPNTHLALETVEFAYDHGQHSDGFHRALFKANFEHFDNLGDAGQLVRIASDHGIDGDELRQALDSGQYRERVDEQIQWARSAGVTGVPTFIFDYKYSMVGAQEYPAFQSVIERMLKLSAGEDAAGTADAASGEDAAASGSTTNDPDWAI